MNFTIVGTGSFYPNNRVTNERLLRDYTPRNVTKEGAPFISSDWLVKNVGIRERSLALDVSGERGYQKKSQAEGGLYDTDFALIVAKKALENARVEIKNIRVVVWVSCTFDYLHCGEQGQKLSTGLGLSSETKFDFHDFGCAGMAPALLSARAYLRDQEAEYGLVIMTNCPSAHMPNPKALQRYLDHQDPWAWAAPLFFGDGAAAFVVKYSASGESESVSNEQGSEVFWVDYKTHPEQTLISYPGGGSLDFPSKDSVENCLFLLDAAAVNKVFAPYMAENWEMVSAFWERKLAAKYGPIGLVGERFKRVYFHQANGRAVQRVAQDMHIPEERAPINVDRLGNTSAASTGILFDEDLRSGKLAKGDWVLFLWVGAGNGAMHGGALVRV